MMNPSKHTQEYEKRRKKKKNKEGEEEEKCMHQNIPRYMKEEKEEEKYKYILSY